MKVNRKKGYFSISAVSKMFSIHQQTVRLYEKEGLINPKRSAGNTRLFSEEDVDQLEEVIYLTHELGINLAGVEMILKLKKQISKMQEDMNKLFANTQEQLQKQADTSKDAVKESIRKLSAIKKSNTKNEPDETEYKKLTSTNNQMIEEVNNKKEEQDDDYWLIEYEE